MGPDDPGRPRIFCIGLNKTATTSLHDALTMLGFRSLHWGGPPVRALVESAIEEGRPLLEDLDPTLDAFSDIEALSLNFDTLDRQYPGSRFILTVRPLDDWVDSRRRHVESNQRKARTGEYQGNWLEIDEPAWRGLWNVHVDRARAHFAGRDDFLEVDLTADPTWDRLCGFLGVAVPEDPFPWTNRGQNAEASS